MRYGMVARLFWTHWCPASIDQGFGNEVFLYAEAFLVGRVLYLFALRYIIDWFIIGITCETRIPT